MDILMRVPSTVLRFSIFPYDVRIQKKPFHSLFSGSLSSPSSSLSFSKSSPSCDGSRHRKRESRPHARCRQCARCAKRRQRDAIGNSLRWVFRGGDRPDKDREFSRRNTAEDHGLGSGREHLRLTPRLALVLALSQFIPCNVRGVTDV